jgi:hypothetical protein
VNLLGEVEDPEYQQRLLGWAPGAIALARARERLRATKGRPSARVNLSTAELRTILFKQSYRCALTRLRFYSLSGGPYGPSIPSIDRIHHDSPYTVGNVRVILLGINGLRGRGSGEDTYLMAEALLAQTDRSYWPARAVPATASRPGDATRPRQP